MLSSATRCQLRIPLAIRNTEDAIKADVRKKGWTAYLYKALGTTDESAHGALKTAFNSGFMRGLQGDTPEKAWEVYMRQMSLVWYMPSKFSSEIEAHRGAHRQGYCLGQVAAAKIRKLNEARQRERAALYTARRTGQNPALILRWQN